MKPSIPVPATAHQEDYLLSPYWAEITEIVPETDDTTTFWFEFTDRELQDTYKFAAGQFNMLYLPGYGEAAVSLSSDPERPERIGHTIRFVGHLCR